MLFRLAAVATTLLLSSAPVSAQFTPGVETVSTTVAYPQPSQSCVSGAHLIVARASSEPPGLGILEGVTSQIMKLISGSDAVSVTYPASFSDYTFSEQEGVVGMKQLVTSYVQMCPDAKIALLGYSQGAQVVGDTVIGSNESFFSNPSTNPIGLGSQYLNQIFAIIQMGDPGFTPNTPGHVGNSTSPGSFPRQNVDAYTQYGFNTKMQTYCDANDAFCADGNSLGVHEGYINEYGAQAASYVQKMFSALPAGSGSGSASPSATASGNNAGSTSAAASTPAKTSASSNNNAASQSHSSATSKTTSSMSNNVLTSNRYHPITTPFSGTFQQVGNLPANAGGIHTFEHGLTGVVMGVAMFVMGFF